MLRGKAEVEANEGERQVQPPQVFIEHAATEFGEPVIDRGEDHEHRAAIDDVVEVGHNEVGVVHMHVEGHLGEGHTGDAAKHELQDEGAGKQHGAIERESPLPEGGNPVEELDPRWNGNEGRGDGEEQPHPGRCATGEHVMGPNHQAQDHNRHDRIHHRHVAEQRLACVHRQDFAHQAKGWQHHDVHRWVRIEPKQVLIDHGIAAGCWVEKACVGHDVEAQQNQRSG